MTLYHDLNATKMVPGCQFSTSLNTQQSITVAGDSVYISLNVGYSSNLWGLKVTVSGTVDRETVTMPWILDLERNIALVSSRYCKALIVGSALSAENAAMRSGKSLTEDQEQSVAKWLSSDLLSAGVAASAGEGGTDDASVMTACAALLDGIGVDSSAVLSSDAGEVTTAVDVPALVSQVLPRLPAVAEPVAVNADAVSVVAACIEAIFGVLLHHNHLTDTLQSHLRQVAAGFDLPVPLDVVKCWKIANRFKRRIVMEYQSRLMAEFNKQAEKKGKSEGETKTAEADSGVQESKDGAGDDGVEAKVDKLALYTSICTGIQERCTLLLRFKPVPVPGAVSSSTAGGEGGMSSPVRAVPPLSKADSSDSVGAAALSDAQRKAQDTVLAWQAAKHLDASIASAHGDRRYDLVVDRVTALLLDFKAVSSGVIEAVDRRRRSAVVRLAGLHAFRAVLQSLHVDSALREAVAEIPPALSATEEDGTKGVAPDVAAVVNSGGVTFRPAFLCVLLALIMQCSAD